MGLLGSPWGRPQVAQAVEASSNLDENRISMGELRASLAQHDAMRRANQQFSAAVVVPTYNEFTTQTSQLVEASDAFAAEPSEATLTTLKESWLAAASSWAKGRAFAFGPIDSLGHNAEMTFPTDVAGVETLLSEAKSYDAKDCEQVSLLPALQGFEAMAYVLYGEEGDKPLDDFSAQERLYLQRLALNAHEISSELLAVWSQGHSGLPGYGTILTTAGEPGNGAYLSVESGAEEIIRGLINCLDVVAHEELPAMIEASELASGEEGNRASDPSQSVNLVLLHSTLQGLQAAYLGRTGEEDVVSLLLQAEQPGLSQWVSMTDAATDADIQELLSTALDEVAKAQTNEGNPQSLTESLSMAQTSLMTAQTNLESEVLALVQQ
ncbi:MAG: imelysin family protein [Cyanobacteria bacterium P01_F01_bin.86]